MRFKTPFKWQLYLFFDNMAIEKIKKIIFLNKKYRFHQDLILGRDIMDL